jgi:hypothetical protein
MKRFALILMMSLAAAGLWAQDLALFQDGFKAFATDMAMILPAEAPEALSSAGIAVDYNLLGGNVRFALLKQNILMPDVSEGLGYNRLMGSIAMPLGMSGESFTFTDPKTSDIYNFTANDAKLAMDWMTDSFDITIQASKSILFPAHMQLLSDCFPYCLLGPGRFLFNLMLFCDPLIDQTQAIHSQPLSEMHHHGWIKRLLVFIAIITKQVLKVRILPDQLHGCFIGQIKFLFAKQGTQRKPDCLGCPPYAF